MKNIKVDLGNGFYMNRLFTILFLFIYFNGFAQLNIDSLKTELEKLPSTPENVTSILKLANNYLTTDIKACKAANPILEQKATEAGNDTLLCRSYIFLAYANSETQNFKQAAAFATKAHELAEKTGRKDLQIRALGTIGIVFRGSFQPARAIEYYKKAIALCSLPEHNSLKATCLGNIGVAYASFPNQDTTTRAEALYYSKAAFDLARSINFTQEVMLQGIHLGDRYRMVGKEDSGLLALKYVRELIPDNNYRRLEQYYSSQGALYQDIGKYDEAISAYQKLLENVIKLKSSVSESFAYYKLYRVHELAKDYKTSIDYYKKYMDTKHVIENKKNTEDALIIQTKYEQALKDNEIIKLKADQAIKDLELERQKATIAGNMLEAEIKENEIKRLQNTEKIRQLELEKQKALIAGNILEAKQKEDEIMFLTQEKQLQAKADSQQLQLSRQETIIREKQVAVQKRTRNYLIGGLVLLTLFSFVLYRNIRAKKKAYTVLESKSRQIKVQALQLSKQAKQIAQFQSQMNPHFVYNALHNIQGLVLTDEKQKANTQIQSLAQLMRKTFSNAEKDDIPVEEEINYLEKYIDFEKAAFGSNLNFEVNVAREAEGALIPPMMIQPIVENAIKHAELQKVLNPYIKVLIETEDNLLAIQVKDNGTGIKKDFSQLDKLSHSMSVIKSRLDLIFKGKADVNNQPVFSIKSIPEINEGTSVKFYLPLNYSY